MNQSPLMKCGHNAMAVDREGKPVCPICAPDDPRAYIVEDEMPNLEGRRARCTYYGKPTRHNECNFGQEGHAICTCEQPSDPEHLPFFRYLGPGSYQRLCKHCGFAIGAHRAEDHRCPVRYTNMKPIPGSYKWTGMSFDPIEYEFDEFYCGCHSWD